MNIKLFQNGKVVDHQIENHENGVLLIQEKIIPEDNIEVEITKTEKEKFPNEIYVGGTKSGAPIQLKLQSIKAVYK